MKLRLPHKFQAALMAALASVSFTTLSSGAAYAAVTLTDIGTWTGYDEDTAMAVVGNTGAAENPIQYGTIYSGSQSWNTSWAHVVTVDTASLLLSDKDLTIYAVNMKDKGGNVGYAEGVKITGTGDSRTVTMTSWSNASVKTQNIDLTQYGTLTFVMNHDWGNNGAMVVDVYADGNFNTKLFTATQSGQKFTDYTIYSAETGTTGGQSKFNNSANKANLSADANVGSYTVLGAGYANGSTVSTQDLQTYYNNITVLQWNGSDNNNWNSTDANWLKWGKGDAMGFNVAGAQALFGKSDNLNKTVNVTGDSAVSVSAVKVLDDYTFNLNGNNLTTGTITIAEGASLAYTGSGAVSGTLAGAGALVVNNAGNTVTVNGTDNYTGAITVTAGTLELTSTVNAGAVTVAPGATLKLSSGGKLVSSGALTLTGATLDVTAMSFRAGSSYTLATAGAGVSCDNVTLNYTLPSGATNYTLSSANNALTLSFDGERPADPAFHVYILTGQSNSQGAVYNNPASSEQLAAYASHAIMWNGNFTDYNTVTQVDTTEWSHVEPQQPVYTNLCMGPEYGFSYMMEKFAAEGVVADLDGLGIIKASLNGGGNQFWVPGSATYNAIYNSVVAALEKAIADGKTNITIDGLLYLQGESNGDGSTEAGTKYLTFKNTLSADLQAWLATQDTSVRDAITIDFADNTVLGQPSQNKGDTDARQQETAGTNTDKNGIGYLYTSDLGGSMRASKSTIHFGGSAQLVIGARYAYAFAVQNGLNVGAVRSSNKDQYLDNPMAWWMETLPEPTDVVKWDLSSVSVSGGNQIQSSLTVGGIKVEDPYNTNSADASTVYITGGTLSVGSSGIELEKGGLSIASAFNTTAAQTWKIAAGKTLEIGTSSASVAFGGAHTVTIAEQTVDAGAGSVKIHASSDAGHDFVLQDGAKLAVNASSSIWSQADITVTDSASFGTIDNGDVTINSLTLQEGASLDFGGDTCVRITASTLTLGGDVTFRMNVNSTTLSDLLTLTSVSGTGNVAFALTQGSAARSGHEYLLVSGWDSSKLTYSVSGAGAVGAPQLTLRDGSLYVTFAGSDPTEDYTKEWVPATGATQTIDSNTVVGNVYDAAKVDGHASEDSSSLTIGNSMGSTAVYFFASNTNGNSGNVYAELQDTSATWVSAVGHNGGDGYRTMGGSYNVKVSGTQATEYTGVFGAVNATVDGNVYLELDNANATYKTSSSNKWKSVNGGYNAQVGGSLTLVVRDGSFTDDVQGGFANSAENNRIQGGVYMQVDGGTFDKYVMGGSRGTGVINNGVHMVINGGTFKDFVFVGNNGGSETTAVVNGGGTLVINDGTFQKGIYAAGFKGTVNDGVTLTIRGGSFAGPIYVGSGSGSAHTNGLFTVNLEEIDNNNSFASYTGVLNGGSSAAGSSSITGNVLNLIAYTALEVKAQIAGFGEMNVTKDSATSIKKSGNASTFGGATALQIDGSSVLTLDADNADWNAATVGMTVEAGGTLQKTGSYNLALGNISGAGTVKLAQGTASIGTFASATADVAADTTLTVNLPGADATLGTLRGAGTVQLNGALSGTDANMKFALGSDWTGTVKLTAANIKDTGNVVLNLNNFGRAGSTIELDGVGSGKSGQDDYLYQPNDAVVDVNLKLTGNFTLSAGTSNKTYTFNGDWSGSGNFENTYTGFTNYAIQLNGNMKDYSGTITVHKGQKLNLGSGGIAMATFDGGSASGTGVINGAGESGQYSDVTVSYMNAVTLGSTFQGALNLVVNTNQEAALTKANTYTGTTVVQSGSLAVRGDGTLGKGQVTIKYDTAKSILNLALGDTAVITANGQDATIANHDVVNANAILGTASKQAAISNASIAVAAGKSLELGNVALNNVDLSGHVNLTSSVTADAMVIKSGSTFDLAGQNMITVAGKLTLESGSTLDLARLFATQEEPVQNAPLRVRSSGSPLLLSSLGGGSSTLSLNDNLDGASLPTLGAITPTDGGTYVLASANDISLADNVNLLNIAEGYTGSLSKETTDGGYNLILTLAAASSDLIWDNHAETSKWNTTDDNWHVGTATAGSSKFQTNDDVKFTKATNGQTVTLDGDITAGNITIEQGADITIKDDDNHRLTGTLKGSGTYALAAGDKTLPTGLTLDSSEWSGVVRLSGTHQNLSLSRDMQGLNSTVELKGVTGWFSEVSAGNIDTFDNDLVLTNDDTTAAVTITAGYTKVGNYYKFAGKVSGDGTFEVNAGATNRFIFSGDVSDWKGQFHVTKAGGNNAGAYGANGSEIVFADDAHVVNATLTRAGGTMNLVADTNTTFNKAVTGFSKLTVTEGNTATFKDVLTQPGNVALAGTLVVDSDSTTASSISGTISGGGAIVKNGTGTLELGGNNTSYTGNITVSSGTLKLNSAHALGADNVSNQSTRSITIDKGGTIDLNSKDDGQYAYILHGGSLVNNGNSDTSSDHAQTTKLTLTDDSSIGGTHKFYLLASGWGDTSVDMGGKVLEKTGSNEIVMWSTNVTNGGTILISDGSLNIDRRSAQKTLSSLDTNINIAKNGSDALKGNFSLAAEHTISSSVAGATMSANVGLEGATTLSADADDSLTLTGVLSNAADSTGSITKSGDGTVTLSGSNNYSGGTTIDAGTLVAGSDGALGSGTTTVNSGGTLELTSTVSTLNNTISIAQGGTLALGNYKDNAVTIGTLTLGDKSILDLSALSITGQEATPITLVQGGSITSDYLNSVIVDFGKEIGKEYTLDVQGNTLVLTFGTPTPAKDLIWDGGSDTWDAGTTAHWHEAESAGQHIAFTNGDNATFDSDSDDATVTMSGAVTAGRVTVGDDANVTLVTGNAGSLSATGGITVDGTLVLDGTSISGTLSGDGVVVGNDIPSAVNWNKSAVLGNLTLDADDWAGTVEVSGGHHEFSAPYVVLNSINQLGTKDSTVRLKGVGGYFDGGTITANIELVNPNDISPAVLITAGTNKTTTFSGNISGNGELKFDKNGGSAETFKFTGDISQWNGSLTTGTQHTGPLTVELAGAQPQTVNASIMQGGTRRALNLKVDNAATFNNTVKVSNVEIAGSEASATFLGDTQINTLAGAGKLVVDGANTTTTIGSGTNFSGAIDLLGGTLDLTNALTGVGAVNLGTGSTAATLKLAAGGNALGSNSTITLGNNLTLDLSNYNSYTLDQPVTLATATGFSGDAASVSLTGLNLVEGYKATLSVVDTTNLVLTISDESENLVWLDPVGTWTAQDAWYESDKSTPATFENGDSGTIVVGNYDDGATISLVADASARSVIVQKAEDGTGSPVVTIKDKVNENRLGMNDLTLQKDTTLVANTQLEVTKTVQIGTDAELQLNSPKDATISANISSTDATAVITKQGDNTLTLTGDNHAYTGKLNVTDGTLAAQSEHALGGADVTVSGGAELSLENRGAMDGVSLTMGDGSTISFLGATELNLSDSLTLGAGVTWDLSRYAFNRPEEGQTTGTATLITGTMDEASIANLHNSTILHPANVLDQGLSLSYENGRVILTYSMNPQGDLFWKGGVGTWNTVSSNTTWYPSREGGQLTQFYKGDNVTFDARAAVSSVTLTEDITAGTVTVENGTRVTLQDGTGNATLAADQIDIAGTLGTNVNVAEGTTVNIAETGMWIVSGDKDREFAGEITGNGTLSKTGDGDLELAHDNSTFTGEIQLNSGTITAADEDALGSGTTIVMGNGTELKQAEGVTAVNMGGKTIEVTNSGANATVSANLDVAQGTILTFAGDGNLAVTQAVTGTGTLSQNGYGTLRLDDVEAFQGSIVINQGGVALGSATNTVDSINVGINTALTFAGTGMMNIDTLTLANGSTVDLSNVTFTNNHATLAIVSTLNAPVSGNSGGNYYCVEGVAAVNAQGLDEGSVVRLRYEIRKDGTTEFYAEIIPQPDKVVFWKGAGKDDPLGYPEGSGIWRPTNTDLTKDEDRALGYLVDKDRQPTVFEARNDGGTRYSSSINFFTLYDSNGDLIEEATVNVQYNTKGSTGIEHIRTMIIDGETRYIIQAENNAAVNEDIQLSPNAVSTLIVKSGAQAEIRDSFASKDASLVLVEEGAKLDYITADAKDRLDFSFMENRGEVAIQTGMAEIARLTNSGTISIEGRRDLRDYNAASLTMGEIVNTGDMMISCESLYPVLGSMITQQSIVNEGNLVYIGMDSNPSADMLVTIPTYGRGIVDTAGDKPILFDQWWYSTYATMEASELNLGAASTTFNYGVDIADATTVKAGKDAYFYGGTGVGGPGSLGEVALEDASSITFGPRVEVDYYGATTGEVTAQSYDMGHVTAGADSVLTVQKGATVTMAGYNAASGVPAGEIVVGTMPAGAPDGYAGTASLTIDGPAAVDTVRVLDDTATITGNASINQIMQDGGTLTLGANSVLNGVPVSEGSETLTGGTVTGGKLVLAGGKTLDQNAVIDVRTAAGSETEGTYTVRGGEGSRIDASDLELIVDYSKTNYVAVVHGGGVGETTSNESGFMASGDEYVKLFDIQYNTEESGEKTPVQTLHGGNEAVYHSGASGMMTLIDSDNWNTILHGEGYDLEEYIGYGYLHTEDKRLTTYYVRDQYTDAEENEVTLTDLIEGSVDPDDPLQLKQLENVVFDKTAYNTGFSPYNGTLTVNAHMDGEGQTKDHTSIDRFSVSGDAKAAINIAGGTTVTANADSTGVAGKLDLQGSGVYEIQDRNDLGTNIALRDNGSGESTDPEWNGTVRVTGTSTDLTLEDKSVGAGTDASTIEFRNWNGALDGGDHTVNGQVVLSDETPTAMKLTGEDDIAYTFTNTVSGGGNINHADGGNVVMTFSGDTSGWNGTYEQQSDTEDSLTFTGGETVRADVISGNGSMDLTYGGTVTTVAGDVNVYSGGDTPTTMNVTYTGADKAVTGGITSDAQSNLTLTVGDGKQATNATFTGTFAGTENATMAVQSGSTATIGTDAELLRVVGDEGSNVVVNSGSTLSLASTTPETGYSEFHALTNAGTIEMMANGGEIHLVDDTAEGNTYNLGNLVLTDPVGTATIETSGVEGKTTNVNISGLTGPKSAAQVLELMNGNGTGTVNYNLGNTDDAKDLNGTIAYGGSGGETNLVIKENGNSAASAVLETRFASADDTATANVVVDAEKARIQGLTSDANSNSNKTMVVSGREDPGDPGNRTLNITGDGEYYYAGQLGENLDIAYTGNGMQVINGGVSGFDGKVTVDNGSTAAGVLAILNAASVDITDLTIGANDRLSVADGTAVVSHSVLATGGPTTEGNGSASTLEGSLTLSSGSTYDVSAAGGIGGLNLTGALTIYEGAQLSSSDISTLWGLEIGDSYDLAFGVVDVNFGDDVVTKDDQIDASRYFTNLYPGEFYICYTGVSGSEGSAGSNVGTVYLYKATPEPTTGTLSLLALAALAARRRRK